MSRYRVLDHTADTGIETDGATLEEVIANAATAMFDLMYESAAGVRVEFAVEPAPPPDLLVAVLSELLYRSEVDGVSFSNITVRIEPDGTTIRAEAHPAGELVGPPIKAVTYHDLRCEPSDDGWHARVIFDV